MRAKSSQEAICARLAIGVRSLLESVSPFDREFSLSRRSPTSRNKKETEKHRRKSDGEEKTGGAGPGRGGRRE